MNSSIRNVSEDPLIILKPKFLTSVAFLKAIPGAVVLGIFGGIIVMMLSPMVTGIITVGEDADINTAVMMFAVGALTFFMLPAILVIWYKKTVLSHIEYRIFPNRIEYFEGFFTVEQKTIKFVDVTEIYLRKGLFQKRNNLGSIFLMSKGMMVPMLGMMKGSFGGAMVLLDIENPDAIYQQLKQLKDKEQT